VSIFEFFKLALKIGIDLSEKFLCCLFTGDLLPIFKDTLMIVFNTIILLSHFHEFFLIVFEEVIILDKFFINVEFMFDIFFLLFETDPLHKIPLRFDSIVLVIKFKVLDFCSVDHT